MKKLSNVKLDHEKRLQELQSAQLTDSYKGQLIELNKELVDRAILIVRSMIASQMDWKDIEEKIKQASLKGDPIASTVKKLKLNINHITMELR